MTLAMTLGMTLGVKRTLWMMIGELIGVAIVASASVLGVASIMFNYPDVFAVLKWLGGAYLTYIGIGMWFSKDEMSSLSDAHINITRRSLFNQGFVTAIANPKGWSFMISLLPPFISIERDLTLQLVVLLGIIMLTEFSSMMAYATGGKTLRVFLSQGDNIKWMNRIAGSLMVAVALWLVLG